MDTKKISEKIDKTLQEIYDAVHFKGMAAAAHILANENYTEGVQIKGFLPARGDEAPLPAHIIRAAKG